MEEVPAGTYYIEAVAHEVAPSVSGESTVAPAFAE
ncbi:hypothetical protein LCGC14_1479620 [marine sediment metagenome]|uniref:Uncharacterized protein n=1 Tax=marine sediment metagenome TaxID=412755 RepID=A0A0F9LQA3_9ZZZZ